MLFRHRFYVRGYRLIAIIAALVLIPVWAVATPASASTEVATATSARTHGEAARRAKASGQRVEIEERTSEYSRTFVAPDGKLTTEISTTPVRVQRGGQWVPADATLEFGPDGSVGPKAAAADLRFSGGGSSPLAKFVTEDGSLSLASPWPLSRPVLSGTTATYAEVLPGVDLVVAASVEGFSYNLVVKTRQAASNPGLRSLRFPVATDQLELRTKTAGRPSYVDGQGRLVLTVGDALMWDSSGQAPGKAGVTRDTARAVDDGPAPGSNVAPMDLSADPTALTVVPDASMLSDPATVFPVVLDPTMVSSRIRNAWTAAWELFPDKSFYKTEHQLGVGYEGFEQNKIVRSFWQFDVAGFAGKKIVSASFRVYETHSANCQPRAVTVSRTSPITAATTWNNQPTWQADVASASFAKGYSADCPDGYVDFDVTGSMQYTASNNGKTTAFRLRATNEADAIAWKQFNSSGLLEVHYIAYPLPPTGLAIAASPSDPLDACATSTDPTVLAERRPTLRAFGRIGAGDNQARVKVQIQVVNPSGDVWTMTSGVVAPFTEVKLNMAYDLSNNTLFRYHARTLYPYDGGELVSAWTGYCFFRIDTTPPPPPTITASYRGQALGNCLVTTPSCPKIVPFGEPVTYTITSGASDVTSLKYRFSGGSTRQVSGRSVTLSLYPTVQGYVDLSAQAGDASARWSTTAYFRLNIGPPSPPVATWRFDEASGPTASDSSGHGQTLAVTGATFDDAGRISRSLVFDGSSDYATRNSTPVDTSKSFTVAAWVRLTDFSEGAVVGIPGSSGFGFQLYYSQGVNRWVFMQSASDAAGAGQARAESLEGPLWGAWTHLVGVYDASAKRLMLYVNGRLQETATFTHTPWRATGPIDIGRYRVGGNYGATFGGSIDHVELWARAMPAPEAKSEANPRETGATNETISALTAHWPFDAGYLASDQIWRTGETVYSANMVLSGFGATADQSIAFVEDEERGRVLQTTGKAAESVSLGRSVVDASGSFTVTAWVRIRDVTRSQVLLRQGDSWKLEYRPTTSNAATWVFGRSTVTATATTTKDNAGDDWTLLVANYDAESGEIQIRPHNRGQDGGEVPFATPLRTGTTSLGAGSNALIDDVRIYAGLASQRRICTEVLGETECS